MAFYPIILLLIREVRFEMSFFILGPETVQEAPSCFAVYQLYI